MSPIGEGVRVDPADLRVEAGPACCEDVPDIYGEAREDASNDLEVLILDHPSMDDLGRIIELGRP